MIVFIVFVKLLIIKLTSQQGKDCFGQICRNNGTLDELSCTCGCPAMFSGINCEYEIQRSFWPPGPYAIPTPIDGCPESYHEGWTEGYVNITTGVSLRIDITNIIDIPLQIPYTLGPYGPYTFQFNFCYKSRNHTNNSMDAWPSGNYKIYGTEDGCQKGFGADNLTLVMPEVISLSHDGDLPYMDISFESNKANISFLVCKRIKDENQNETLFMAQTPFILIEGSEDNCTIFEGFNVARETLKVKQFDKDSTGIFPLLTIFTLHHCYYTPLNYGEVSLDGTDWFKQDKLNTCQSIVSVRIHFPDGYDRLFTQHTRGLNSITVSLSVFSEDAIEYAEYVQNRFKYSLHIPWLLIDLKMTTPIYALVTFLKYSPRVVWVENNSEFRYPKVYLSNEQWSFLRGGAVLGRSITYREMPLRIAHVFLKRIEGRYLSIVPSKLNKFDTLEMDLFLKMTQFQILTQCGDDINEFQSVCHRELGMLEDIIKYEQLSASSWQDYHHPGKARQYLTGWCAAKTDVNPFLQVDLISITTITGITVINGYTNVVYKQEREYLRKVVTLGCKSFRLHHGIDLKSLKKYNATFELDLSLPYTEQHTKVFRKPFLARYVRIYPEAPQDANNAACLRLELLGCAKTVITSEHCDSNSIIYIANSAPVSTTNSTSDIGDATLRTWLDCFKMCMQAEEKCSSLLNTDDYKPMVQLLADYRSIAEISQDNIFRIIEPGVFTSVGYPYHYFPDQLYMWNITFMDGAYVQLSFSNVSLHEYKGVTYDSISECIDVIEIRQGITEREIVYMIDYRKNGATPTIATNKSTIYVVLRTCYRVSEKLQKGIGFRAIVKKNDVPNCYNTYTTSCYMKKMSFGSHLYFGLHQTSNIYTWFIKVNDVRPIILKFIDFDINCQEHAKLKVRSACSSESIVEMCNTNRPIGPINTKSNDLSINYYTPPNSDYKRYDGFYAEYSIQEISPDLLEIVTSMTVHPLQDVHTYFDENVKVEYANVCSKTFKKCYSIYPSSNRSWQEASDYCWSYGMHLASFHSQLEYQLLRTALVNFTNEDIILRQIKHNNCEKLAMDTLLYSYIGLRRYKAGTGKQDELWEDDTPLTFTAWGAREPADVQIKQCTRISFDPYIEEDTWETTYCNIKPGTAGYFICSSKGKQYTKQGLSNTRNTFVPMLDVAGTLFKCEDGTRIFPLSVCDGLPDCPDWSDEIRCSTDVDIDEEMFLCNDGRYIHISYICNYVQDCYDGSDEYCEFSTCKLFELQCDNKQCIPYSRACDGVVDCKDGSDERKCDTCDPDTAVRCGDSTCKPKSLVCDNHVDCIDAMDENGCDQKPMSSCSEVWTAGHRENGTYKLVDGNTECQFYVQDVENTNHIIVNVRTIIHSVYIASPIGNGYMLINDNSIRRIAQDQSCIQKVLQICEPHLLTLAEHDGKFEHKLYDDCFCKMMLINHHHHTMQHFTLCSSFDDSAAMHAIPYSPSDMIRLNATNGTNIRYILQPTICDSAFVAPKTIACEHSQLLIPDSRRCLYSKDAMGRIEGCRSMTHLQHCETFECPIDYVKCPNSFCIAIKHVCDGEKNCPEGHDEENCWCQKNMTETVIVFNATNTDGDTRNVIYNLAQQLYTASERVRVVQLSTKDSTTDISVALDEVLVSDVTIDSNDKRLNRYLVDTYVVNSIDLIKHIRDSFTNKSFGNNIILINNSMSVIDLLQFDKETPFKTLYFSVDIDERINKKAEITTESRITRIKIRKFGSNFMIDPFIFKQICKEQDFSSCKHMYKCESSRVCIHLSQVCDGKLDCPYGDDEYKSILQFTCPNKCRCKGLMIDCRNVQLHTSDLATISSETRALDVSQNTEVRIISFETEMQYLYQFNLSNSGLQAVDRIVFSKLRNLQILDLSYNKFEMLPTDIFKDLKSLTTLYLSGSKLLTTIQPGAFNGLTAIKTLSITETRLNTILTETYAGLHLSKLDLSFNQISTIEEMAFNNLEVETIDIGGNDIIHFNKDMFSGVRGLQFINSNAYKFCCIRPSTVKEVDCLPFKDEFSSCDDLMRNDALKALLWVIGICALLGNIISLVYIFIQDTQRLKLGYGIFVTNLSVADLMMGIHLLIIAVADTVYRDRYIWSDEYWRNSIWCSFAGVLSTVASEASVLFVCLITLDRLLVIKFPFGKIRFKTNSAILSSILSWMLALFIAVYPLIHSDYFQNQFYTKSGVCIALPLTRDRPPGWQYSVAIFIGFNFVTFLLIALSQWLIYNEINYSSKRVDKQSKNRGNDLKITRNLLFVVTTDFLCWFPIGCMGLMALNGHTFYGDVYAWAAVLILPINSAINPFMYTLSRVLNKGQFLPSIDEQSRLGPEDSKFTEHGKFIVTILDSRIFRLPTSSTGVPSTSLAEYIENKNVTTRAILTIAVRITCDIRYLHECNLVLEKLDMDNVYAVTSIDEQVIDYVQLQLKPSLCTNNIQKMDDVYCLGVIIRTLVNKSHMEHF